MELDVYTASPLVAPAGLPVSASTILSQLQLEVVEQMQVQVHQQLLVVQGSNFSTFQL